MPGPSPAFFFASSDNSEHGVRTRVVSLARRRFPPPLVLALLEKIDEFHPGDFHLTRVLGVVLRCDFVRCARGGALASPGNSFPPTPSLPGGISESACARRSPGDRGAAAAMTSRSHARPHRRRRARRSTSA